MNYQRGDIYYIAKVPRVDSEQHSGRPAIVVSCDWINKHSPVLEIVYLTTRKKPNLQTHVKIMSSGTESTAICEQIYSISVNRIGRYCGRCTPSELNAIDKALNCSLALTNKADASNLSLEFKELKQELEKLKIQYATLRDLHVAFANSKNH